MESTVSFGYWVRRQRRALDFTQQALAEAQLAASLGYNAGLLSLGDWRTETEAAMIEHCRAVAGVIPLFGFYLQPAVGGRVLSYDFWRRFAEIPNVWAIKIAPFNRYATIDVIRAVAEAERRCVRLPRIRLRQELLCGKRSQQQDPFGSKYGDLGRSLSCQNSSLSRQRWFSLTCHP